jgi:hypothetical protein
MSVNLVNAGPSGSVTLVAGSNLIQAVSSDAAEVVAATANLPGHHTATKRSRGPELSLRPDEEQEQV